MLKLTSLCIEEFEPGNGISNSTGILITFSGLKRTEIRLTED